MKICKKCGVIAEYNAYYGRITCTKCSWVRKLISRIDSKKKSRIYLINFSAMNVSTGKIGGYILNKLYKELGFANIGYEIVKNRCYLYTIPDNDKYLEYFNDRCPAMIENDVKKSQPEPHSFNKWDNGFEEVTRYID